MNTNPVPATTSSAPIDINNLTTGASNAFSSISNSISDARTGLNSAVSDFSSKSAVDASSEFLESNTMIAKFAFIIVALILFMILFRIGMMIMAYFFSPSPSPYLVQGMIVGNEASTIPQDTRTDYPVIKLSENEASGIEFTYSVWILLKGETDANYHHVFNKGAFDPETATGTAIGTNKGNNAPGLFIKTTNGTSSARIYMDTMKQEGQLASGKSSRSAYINVTMPHKKWVNIIIRIQNRIMDVYVNGVLTGRKDLEYIPRQNYGDVNICQNGGFAGNLSNLRYFDSALNVFQINQLVTSGPNTSTSKSTTTPSTGYYYYLSSQFA
jgi:hypothetical protein